MDNRRFQHGFVNAFHKGRCRSWILSGESHVILLTGDDEARLRQDLWARNEASVEREFALQVRQNVAFEAGRAFTTHPERTIVCQIGDVKPFSDMGGLHLVKLDSIEGRQELVARLRKAGLNVNATDDAWRQAGDFSAPRARPSPWRTRAPYVFLLAAALALGLVVGRAIGNDRQRTLIQAANYAADHVDKLGLQTAIANGAPIDGHDENNATPVWFAVSQCNLDLVDWLLINGANPNVQYSCLSKDTRSRGWTPLRLAEGRTKDTDGARCVPVVARLKSVNAYGAWKCPQAQ